MHKILSTAGIVMGAPIGISTSFILEVVGAIGAVWGGSQTLGLRNDANEEIYRTAAMVVGGVALVYHVTKHMQRHRNYPNSSGFFQNFVAAVNNPYGAIYSQFKPTSEHELEHTVIV